MTDSSLPTTAIGKQAEVSFVIYWVIACAIGTAVGGTLGIMAGENIGFQLGGFINKLAGTPTEIHNTISSTIAGILNGSVSSAVIGFAQWLILRKYLARAGWWIPASMIGVTVGAALNSAGVAFIQMLLGGQTDALALLICGAILLSPFIGLLSAIPEWGVLQRQVWRSGWWIVARVVSMVFLTFIEIPMALLSFAVGGESGRLLCTTGSGLFSGLIFGVTTGLTLYWLFNHEAPSVPKFAMPS